MHEKNIFATFKFSVILVESVFFLLFKQEVYKLLSYQEPKITVYFTVILPLQMEEKKAAFPVIYSKYSKYCPAQICNQTSVYRDMIIQSILTYMNVMEYIITKGIYNEHLFFKHTEIQGYCRNTAESSSTAQLSHIVWLTIHHSKVQVLGSKKAVKYHLTAIINTVR